MKNLQKLFNPCVSGSILTTYDEISSLANTDLSCALLKEKYDKRFFNNDKKDFVLDNKLDNILDIYQDYFRKVLVSEEAAYHVYEQELLSDLCFELGINKKNKQWKPVKIY